MDFISLRFRFNYIFYIYLLCILSLVSLLPILFYQVCKIIRNSAYWLPRVFYKSVCLSVCLSVYLCYTNIQHPSKANCSQPLQATTQRRSYQTPPTIHLLTPMLSAMLTLQTLQWPQAIRFGNSWRGINHSTYLHLAWEQLPTLPPIE